MAKKMTESQAWAFLAKLWAKKNHFFDGDGDVFVQLDGDKGQRHGICDCIGKLNDMGRLTVRTECKMRDRIGDHPAYELGEFVWPLTTSGARSRAAFCRRMAKATSK